MKLERLEISGFMHFTEPAVLDLRDVQPGLVAITGENGNGKTRLLDAGPGAVFGAFPSRDGNIADYATSREAFIEALYHIEGRGEYRARINVDGLKRNSDAVLELINADGSRTPLNDGKVSTFKEATAQIFPTKELLLASAFAAQNRSGSFVSLDRSKRKDLFGKLLGLDHYARMCETAKACLDLSESARMRLTERRELLARETAPPLRDALDLRAKALQVEGGNAEVRRRELQARLDTLTGERDALVDQASAHLASLERVKALADVIALRRAEMGQLDHEHAGAQAAAQTDRTRADIQRVNAQADLDRRDSTERSQHATTVKDLDERIANNRKVLADADAIHAAVAAQGALVAELAGLRRREDLIRKDLDAIRQQLRDTDKRLSTIENQRYQLADAHKKTETLKTVPCGGVSPYASCRFLADAAQAQASIPSLEEALTTAAEFQTTSDGLKAKLSALQDLLGQTTTEIRAGDDRLAMLQPKAKLEPHIAAAEARIAEYERTREQSRIELTARLADLATQRNVVDAQHGETVADITRRLDTRLAELDSKRRQLEQAHADAERLREGAEAEASQTEAAATRLVALETELTDVRAKLSQTEAALAVYATKREQLDRERVALAEKIADLEDVAGRLRQVEDRALVWQVFVKAFGRDGLPTLEIAAAGPTVSNLTNDLLSVCFNTRFTVELVTQEERADKKGLKETFELKVFDNEFGGEPRDIADLSGGERVIVEEALRAALALYVNSRNVAPIRTCWRDETTGALDPENATRYVAMLRRLLDLGGFSHILFITHNPDAAALADTHIVVTNGQPEILRRAA